MSDGSPCFNQTRTHYCSQRLTRQSIRELFSENPHDQWTLTIIARKFCYTIRERTMLALINELTDMPEWCRKIFDEDFTFTWKSAKVMGGPDITRSMVDWVR